MPAGVGSVNGIVLAVEVGLLVQHRVAREEAPHLRVVVPGPNVAQPRVPVVAANM